MAHEIARQAQMLAFNDLFWFIAVVTLAIIPLIFVMKRPEKVVARAGALAPQGQGCHRKRDRPRGLRRGARCRTKTGCRLPADFGARGADIRRNHALPANGVGVRVHDVGPVHHVFAHATAPIRLRLCAAWRLTVTELSFFCPLVFVDVSDSASCARLTAVSLSKPSAVPDSPTQPAHAGAPWAGTGPPPTMPIQDAQIRPHRNASFSDCQD